MTAIQYPHATMRTAQGKPAACFIDAHRVALGLDGQVYVLISGGAQVIARPLLEGEDEALAANVPGYADAREAISRCVLPA